MEAFVIGLHIVLCFFLILVVLLQPGKGADFGAMMGGSTQSGGSAAQGMTLIGKLTAVVATLFMMTSMTLAWFSNRPQASVITDDALQTETDVGDEAVAPAGDESDGSDAEPAGDVGDGGDASPEGAADSPDGSDQGDAGEAAAAPAGEDAAPAAEEPVPAGEGSDESPDEQGDTE